MRIAVEITISGGEPFGRVKIVHPGRLLDENVITVYQGDGDPPLFTVDMKKTYHLPHSNYAVFFGSTFPEVQEWVDKKVLEIQREYKEWLNSIEGGEEAISVPQTLLNSIEGGEEAISVPQTLMYVIPDDPKEIKVETLPSVMGWRGLLQQLLSDHPDYLLDLDEDVIHEIISRIAVASGIEDADSLCLNQIWSVLLPL